MTWPIRVNCDHSTSYLNNFRVMYTAFFVLQLELNRLTDARNALFGPKQWTLTQLSYCFQILPSCHAIWLSEWDTSFLNILYFIKTCFGLMREIVSYYFPSRLLSWILTHCADPHHRQAEMESSYLPEFGSCPTWRRRALSSWASED